MRRLSIVLFIFFDTSGAPIPESATMVLLGFGF
jgi:hypothetical protein